MRLFFALWPPARVAARLGALAADCARRYGGRATRSDTVHLTLSFLGEVADDRLERLIEVARGVDAQRFALAVDRLGYWSHNHLLWAGSRSPPGALIELVARLRGALAEAGFADAEPAREFAAHVTLVRRLPSSRAPGSLSARRCPGPSSGRSRDLPWSNHAYRPPDRRTARLPSSACAPERAAGHPCSHKNNCRSGSTSRCRVVYSFVISTRNQQTPSSASVITRTHSGGTMSRNVSALPLAAAILFALPGTAGASGFQLTEQNASGLGNAYAGSAAVAENASTLYYNPAGMTQLRDREVSAGLAAIGTSFKFSDNGSSVGALAGTGNGGDGGGWGFVPNGYLTWALSRDLYVGIGIGAPYGLKTEYQTPWLGAAQSTSFDVKTYNINPSIAYRVNDAVSLGFGVSWQRLETTYTRQLATISPAFAASQMKLTLSGELWGWNAGALFTLSPATKIGVSYRSAMRHKTDGNIDVSGPSPQINAAYSSDARARLNIPYFFVLSATHKLDERWEMLGDVSYTGWGLSQSVDIYRSSNTGMGTGNGNLAQQLITEFRNTWRVALGANYTVNDAWKLRFGLAYDQTPTQNPGTRLTAMPDNNRVWFSFGTQWRPDKQSTLDVGVAYLYLRDSQIDNDQRAAPDYRGLVSGSYNASAWILGAQYSLAF